MVLTVSGGEPTHRLTVPNRLLRIVSLGIRRVIEKHSNRDRVWGYDCFSVRGGGTYDSEGGKVRLNFCIGTAVLTQLCGPT